MRAWHMKKDPSEDQRCENRLFPALYVSRDTLARLGVLYQHIDPADYASNDSFKIFKNLRGYDYQDIVEISPSTLENFEEKIKSFYDEHIHTHDEVRYILDGSGYFDVRDLQDRWIRIEVEKGDLICLPAGIFHRFTLDEKNYIKALRMFNGNPEWTPYSRSILGRNDRTREIYKRKYAGCEGSYMLNRFIHSIW